ncbi:MAG TPA: hypothetical protein VNL14_16735 [Candidatus Acidoferrales bacterium]|nr:hypothetical protein [Candidatus Acidoferrales bacterium]
MFRGRFPYSTVRRPRRWTPTSAGGANTFTYAASGGANFAGAAAIAVIQVYDVSAGLAAGGAAQVAAVQVYETSGGVTLAGAASVSVIQVADATGGLAAAGSAEVSVVQVQEPFGGVLGGGFAERAIIQVYQVSGGASSGGAANTQFIPGAQTFTYVASGGALFSGAAGTQFVSVGAPAPVFVGSGRIRPRRRPKRPERLPSTLQVYNIWVPFITGGLVFGGSAHVEFVPAPRFTLYECRLEASGISAGGSAEIQLSFSPRASAARFALRNRTNYQYDSRVMQLEREILRRIRMEQEREEEILLGLHA